MKTLYEQTINAKNKSENMSKFFKRNPQCTRVYATTFDHEKHCTLGQLKNRASKSLRRLVLYVASPNELIEKKGYRRGGFLLNGGKVSLITTYRRQFGSHIITKDKFVLDVTELFVERYNKEGRCVVHGEGHDFKDLSPKVKQCLYCELKLYKKVVVKKSIEWLEKDEK